MYVQRLFSVFILLLAFINTTQAQEDCSEFTAAVDYATRGRIAFDERLFEDAVIDYTCALQISPDNLNYHNERGNAYYWLQEDAKARADYMRVIELDPEAGYAYNNLANLYANIGDYDQAFTYYDMAIALPSGRDEVTYTNVANILTDMGRYEDAQANIDSARGINPAYPSLYLTQAYLYSIQNDAAQAAENYREWLQKTRTRGENPQYVVNRSYVTSTTTGNVISITVAMNAGDTFSASAAAIDNLQHVDPLIVLVGPDGTALVADDDSGVNIDAVISQYVVGQTGNYTLMVGNAGGYYHEGVDGRIRISLQRQGADGTLIIEPTPVPTVVVQPTAVATVAVEPTPGTNDTIEPTPAANIESDAPVESEELTVSFATFRLFVGVTAEVYTTEGDRLNLRGGPGLRFEIINKLDKGALITLLEGPRKQDGLAWWKIRTHDGVEGWAVERVETEQTLQMALSVGEQAIVTTNEDSLNMRSGAGRSNNIVTQLADGERVTLLQVTAELVDGFQWWHVRLNDGREGWVIDRLDGERLLIPAKEREGTN